MRKDGSICRLSFSFVLASPMNVVRVMPVEGAKFYGTRTARTEWPTLRSSPALYMSSKQK